MVPFLLINILVSTVTVVLVWSALQRRGAVVADAPAPVPTVTVATAEQVADAPPVADERVAPVEEAVVAEPTPEPEPTTPSGPTVHVVQQGDSMGGIAVQYDVSMDDITAANGIDDPNTIFVGQELIIPTGDGAVDVVAAEPGEEPTPTAIPTLQVGVSLFEISSVTGVGDVAAEQVVITNVGPEAVNLEGWSISDDAGDTYTFPDILLFGGGVAVTLHSTTGEDNVLDYYWDREAAAWASGDVLVLRNPDGEIAAELAVP